MRLRHIEVFQAIMQCGTLSAAAQHLNVSQPNVTKVLAHAEQQLGFALFLRIKGRLQPTEEALALLPEVTQVYAQLGRLNTLSQRLAAGYTGHVRLAVTPTLGQAVLPRILPKFHRQCPQVVTDVQTLHGNTMVQQLLAGDLDIGLAFSPSPFPGIVCEPLYDSALRVMLPEVENTHIPNPLPVEQLASLPWPLIALNPRDPLGAQLQTLLAQSEHTPEIIMTLQTYSLAVDLVREGLGFAVVDSFTAKAYDREHLLRELHPHAPFNVSLLYAEQRPPSKVATQLLECLREGLQAQ